MDFNSHDPILIGSVLHQITRPVFRFLPKTGSKLQKNEPKLVWFGLIWLAYDLVMTLGQS